MITTNAAVHCDNTRQPATPHQSSSWRPAVRWWMALIAACGIGVPRGANSQTGCVPACTECVLGIWNDPGLRWNYGSIAPLIPKSLYLGMKVGDGFDGFTGLEFSIAGMRTEEDGIVLLFVEELVPITIRIGTFQAPADTSATTMERGGIGLAWSRPVTGNQPLLRLEILVLEPVTDLVLRVTRRYPTSNTLYCGPVLIDRTFDAVRLTGGCYTLNPGGDPNTNCDIRVSVANSTWGGIKGLYR